MVVIVVVGQAVVVVVVFRVVMLSDESRDMSVIVNPYSIDNVEKRTLTS